MNKIWLHYTASITGMPSKMTSSFDLDEYKKAYKSGEGKPVDDFALIDLGVHIDSFAQGVLDKMGFTDVRVHGIYRTREEAHAARDATRTPGLTQVNTVEELFEDEPESEDAKALAKAYHTMLSPKGSN
jgi:hypothetical protein